MKVTAVDSFPYALPLVKPVPGAPAGTHERAGLLIRLRSETGAEGWGDIAPLPGFSRETLAEARTQLSSLRHVLLSLPAFTQQASWAVALLNPLSAWDLFSSFRFGLECAVCNLAAAEWKTPWRLKLAESPLSSLRLNALLARSHAEILREAQTAVARGYRTLKIKVGRYPVREEIDTVLRVSALLPRHAALRLDANRAWPLTEALEFAQGVRDCPMEYIEEPVRDATMLDEFIRRSGLPVALDESLGAVGDRPLTQGLRAIVIKPTLRGGLSGALRWSRIARQAGVTPVISSAFESSVGLRALAELASVVHDPDVAAGLDTGRWLARDVAEPAFEVARGGRVDVTALSAQPVKVKQLL